MIPYLRSCTLAASLGVAGCGYPDAPLLELSPFDSESPPAVSVASSISSPATGPQTIRVDVSLTNPGSESRTLTYAVLCPVFLHVYGSLDRAAVAEIRSEVAPGGCKSSLRTDTIPVRATVRFVATTSTYTNFTLPRDSLPPGRHYVTAVVPFATKWGGATEIFAGAVLVGP